MPLRKISSVCLCLAHLPEILDPGSAIWIGDIDKMHISG